MPIEYIFAHEAISEYETKASRYINHPFNSLMVLDETAFNGRTFTTFGS